MFQRKRFCLFVPHFHGVAFWEHSTRHTLISSFCSRGCGQLKFNCTSLDETYCLTHSFSSASLSYSETPLMSYVACIYDSKWWISLIDEKVSNEGNMCINFLHPERLLFIISRPEKTIAGFHFRKFYVKFSTLSLLWQLEQRKVLV